MQSDSIAALQQPFDSNPLSFHVDHLFLKLVFLGPEDKHSWSPQTNDAKKASYLVMQLNQILNTCR